MQQVQATYSAFAAILEDGSVITWGEVQTLAVTVRQFKISSRVCGRFKPQVGPLLRFWKMDLSLPGVMQTMAVTVRQFEDQLKGVQQIQATGGAFAAILEDGSVVTWGRANQCGDSSAVRDQLKGVQQIQATNGAFAAILEDGSVVTWGNADFGGDSAAVRDQLKGVQQVQATVPPLLQFWKMDQSLPGVKYTLAVSVRQFKISSRVCSRFKPQVGPLLRFWKMDLSLPGVMQTMAVTVLEFEISSRVCSRFKRHIPGAFAAILEDGSVVTWGRCKLWR